MAELIQKATEWDKQSAAFKKVRPLETLHQTHIMQPKYDGCHMLIDTTAQRAFSRTNETVRSCDHLIKRCVDLFGPGAVIQGEAYMQDTPFPFISGKYRQHAPWEPMEYVVYDALPDWAFRAGRYDEPYYIRQDWLYTWAGLEPISEGGVYMAAWAWANGTDVQAKANEYVKQGGYDGLMLRDPNAPWVAGPARKGELVKVKPTATLDLRCNGVIRGEGKHAGRLGAISVSYRGATSCVGTGFSDDERELLWRAACDGTASSPIGQIVEIECMAVNPNNTLREPRFKGIRWDKERPDE
jgi:DNA ligase-1